MSPENLEKYNEMVRKVNGMTMEELDVLVADDSCPYEPQWLLGVPMGMHHCPVCGEMVIAGVVHPRRSDELDIGYMEPMPDTPDNSWPPPPSS